MNKVLHWIRVWAVLAPLIVSGANWRLRRTQPSAAAGSSAGWEDMVCFMDLARFGLTATKDDIVFRSGLASADGTPEVLVVQDQGKNTKATRRTLVFRSADGKCNEQAGTICAASDSGIVMPATQSSSLATSAFGDDAALLAGGAAASLDKCSMLTCTADVDATLKEPGAGYVRSMVGAAVILPSKPNNERRFLSIGLGAGTMALLLQQSFPGSHQTVVELSPDVAAVAPCFGASSTSGLDVTIGDGREYLENAADGSFDAVFLDAFDASDKVPSCFTTSEFFQTAKRKLRPGGMLVMNAHSGATLHNDVADLLPAANATFGSGRLQVGKAPGLANAIVLAQVEQSEKQGVSFAQGANNVNNELSSWFQDAVFTPVESLSSTMGRALTDADVKCSR